MRALPSVQGEWLSDAQSDSCQTLVLDQLGLLRIFFLFSPLL